MTTPILDRIRYENSTERWRDTSTGRFIPQATVADEMLRHSDATHSTLEALTRQLYAGDINLARWQVAVASELKDAHLAQAMFGAGGRANMGFAEFGRVGQTLREQYSYLDKFAADIAAGRVSEAMALSRVAHYGDSSKASYWNEFIARSDGLLYWDDVPDKNECGVCPQIAAGSPYTKETIPSSPGDGKTPCKGRCRCRVRRGGIE